MSAVHKAEAEAWRGEAALCSVLEPLSPGRKRGLGETGHLAKGRCYKGQDSHQVPDS